MTFPLRFGVAHDFRRPLDSEHSLQDVYAQTLEQIALLDRLGLDLVRFSEHHFVEDGYLPNFVPVAGAAAAVTSQMRISTNISIVPFAHPIRLAEDMAVLDQLSGGRMELGIGLGYAPHEFRAFGIPVAQRVSRTEECIDILRLAWSGESFSYGLYDPCAFNDRMLLGLKGTLSEAELHFLKARLRGGQLTKARTGELVIPLPVGLVYDPAGRVVLDPDQGVRDAVAHLFATFARTGSARATVKAFATDGLSFPSRVQTGPNKGLLAWLPLRHHRVLQVLHNPRYAGAFAYGRRRQRRAADGRTRHTLQPRESWTALIPDAHDGYIPWDTYEQNLRRLAECAQAHGEDRRASPPREGPALLQGVAICGRCGGRMTVRYHTRRGVSIPEYRCQRAGIEDGGPICAAVAGDGVDAAIGELLLATVTPLALDVALAVQAELEGRAAQADALRRQHVERARHAAEQARRRYLAVDPDNRLVAANLEADWNEALRNLTHTHDDYERQTATAAPLGEHDKARIAALASDFPALWSDPRTPQRERKRMVRLLIEDVTLIRGHDISVHVRFKGGPATTLHVAVGLPAPEARRTPVDVIAHIDRLLDDHTEAGVADELNRAGVTSGTGQAFHPGIVHHIRVNYRLASRQQRLAARGLFNLDETAARLGVCTQTVKRWHHQGRLHGEALNDKGSHYYQVPEHPPDAHTGRPPNTAAKPASGSPVAPAPSDTPPPDHLPQPERKR